MSILKIIPKKIFFSLLGVVLLIEFFKFLWNLRNLSDARKVHPILKKELRKI